MFERILTTPYDLRRNNYKVAMPSQRFKKWVLIQSLFTIVYLGFHYIMSKIALKNISVEKIQGCQVSRILWEAHAFCFDLPQAFA